MAEYLAACDAKGYIKPSYYQGHYNILTRQAEESLFPLLRTHNVKIMAYGPLAGGFLTGKVSLPPPTPDLTKDEILKFGCQVSGTRPTVLCFLVREANSYFKIAIR